jgi:PAS domain S-box-containing protein
MTLKAKYSAALRERVTSTGLVIGLGALVIAFIAATFTHSFVNEQTEFRQTARLAGEALAQALTQHAIGSIHGADMVLWSLANAIAEERRIGAGRPERIDAILDGHLARLPEVTQFIVLDRDGRVLHDTDQRPAMAQDLSGQPYFSVHRDAPGQEIYVGPPVRGPGSVPLTIPVSRRIENARGGFAGVAVALLNPDRFVNFYRTINRPYESHLSLFFLDGTYLVHDPADDRLIGTSAADTRLFAEYLVRASTDSFEDENYPHGPSIVSYRAVGAYPLIVAVASPLSAVLAQWKRDLFSNALAYLASALMVAFLTFLVARHVARRDQSERRFADFVEIASDWLWELDADLRYSYLSDRMSGLTGILPRDALGKTAPEAAGTPDDAVWGEHMETLAERRSFRDFVYPFRAADGQRRYFRISGKPLFDKRGQFTGYRGVAEDVTRLHEAEVKLRQRAREFAVFFEQSPIGMILAWPDGRIRRANPSMAAMLHHDADELAGRPLRGIAHADDATTGDDAREALLQGSVTGASGEVRFLDKTGRQVVALVTVSAVRDDMGRPLFLVYQAVDISHRKRSEEELSVAKDAAEASNRAKSGFLANMSHELRTPLNAIIGFSEIMERQIFGPISPVKYLDYARDIRASGEHLLDLISDILDLSRIEAGKHELLIEVINLQQECDATMHLLTHRAQEAGLQLVNELPEEPIKVLADRRAFKQIALNLLSNAIKFTPEGGRVTVRARPFGQHCAVSIADTGIGIGDGELQRLGRPFEQVDNVFNRKHSGSGLGLALCKSLAELQGGRLRIRSRLGVGTTVTVELPLPQSAIDAQQSPLKVGDAAQ